MFSDRAAFLYRQVTEIYENRDLYVKRVADAIQKPDELLKQVTVTLNQECVQQAAAAVAVGFATALLVRNVAPYVRQRRVASVVSRESQAPPVKEPEPIELGLSTVAGTQVEVEAADTTVSEDGGGAAEAAAESVEVAAAVGDEPAAATDRSTAAGSSESCSASEADSVDLIDTSHRSLTATTDCSVLEIEPAVLVIPPQVTATPTKVDEPVPDAMDLASDSESKSSVSGKKRASAGALGTAGAKRARPNPPAGVKKVLQLSA